MGAWGSGSFEVTHSIGACSGRTSPFRRDANLDWLVTRPEGSEHAPPTIGIEGVEELVEALRAA